MFHRLCAPNGILTAFAVLACAVLSVPAWGGEPPAAVARFHGTYEYVGTVAEQQARLDAIDATVDQMARFMRVFARKRIRGAAPIPATTEIVIDGDHITLIRSGETGLKTRHDGTPVETTGDSDNPQTVTRTLIGACIKHHAQQARGSGSDRYCLSADGQTLTATVTIASDHLPSDIVYDLSYQRTSGP